MTSFHLHNDWPLDRQQINHRCFTRAVISLDKRDSHDFCASRRQKSSLKKRATQSRSLKSLGSASNPSTASASACPSALSATDEEGAAASKSV